MKVYLSGPMRGHPDLNFPAFHYAAAKLREKGFFVHSPAEEDDPDIRIALQADTSWICRQAEIVAVLPGWETSRGAKMEIALAHALGINVMYLGEEYVK